MIKFILALIKSLFRQKEDIDSPPIPEPVVPPAPEPIPESPIPPPLPAPEPPKPPKTAPELLYDYAVTFLGKDASPLDIASDELGCAETICDIIHGCFGDFPLKGGTIISTTVLYKKLKAHPKFEMVINFGPGDILVSPTGYGNGNLKNGHTAIVGKNNTLMSNNSDTGLFSQNYTIDTWIARYRKIGGFPLFFFRRTVP